MSSYFSQTGDGQFQLSGELSFATVNGVLEESRTVLFGKPSPRIDIDLGTVTRADSAGLALLIEWLRMAQQKQCDICYYHLPEQMIAIAEAGDLISLLPVAD